MNFNKRKYWKGVIYAFITSFLWGLLPVLLEFALKVFSAGTIVWFRFIFAFFFLFLILSFQDNKPNKILFQPPLLGILAGVSLAANYLYFILGIQSNGPTNAAILMQLAPVLVVLTGIIVFKERLQKSQTTGLFVATIGFLFFYWEKTQHSLDFDSYAARNNYLYFAAVVWALFAFLLKKLSSQYPAQTLNLLIFGVASLALTSGVHWESFTHARFEDWILLVILGLNTLIAYGSLSEAIRLIPLSLTTVITTINPLFTLITTFMINTFQPQWLRQDSIGVVGYLGGLIIILGVALIVYKPIRS